MFRRVRFSAPRKGTMVRGGSFTAPATVFSPVRPRVSFLGSVLTVMVPQGMAQARLSVYDAAGRRLATTSGFQPVSCAQVLTCSLHGAGPGVYFYSLYIDGIAWATGTVTAAE